MSYTRFKRNQTNKIERVKQRIKPKFNFKAFLIKNIIIKKKKKEPERKKEKKKKDYENK